MRETGHKHNVPTTAFHAFREILSLRTSFYWCDVEGRRKRGCGDIGCADKGGELHVISRYLGLAAIVLSSWTSLRNDRKSLFAKGTPYNVLWRRRGPMSKQPLLRAVFFKIWIFFRGPAV